MVALLTCQLDYYESKNIFMRCGSCSPILYVVICVFINRLGDFFNIKIQTHGLNLDGVTLLHVWAMEDSTV